MFECGSWNKTGRRRIKANKDVVWFVDPKDPQLSELMKASSPALRHQTVQRKS